MTDPIDGMTAGSVEPEDIEEPVETLPTDDPADDTTPVEGAPI